MSNSFAQRMAWVLWPSFLMACAAEFAFFAVIDPADLGLFGVPLEIGRMNAYTIGFFAFWTIGIGSSALTVFLARSPFEVNRCPFEAKERPPACARRDDDDPGCGPSIVST